ncbi:hypothetical protein [Actinocorallia populi]|uniref:hypothetical protein n=1 Tax=Actinocorallia populi TaxID=2079200 RepID=UPI000D093C5F|nr:hypothetical protein [Actinocorallia populi]
MVDAQRDITVSELDDLIGRMREAGQDPREIEEFKTVLSGGRQIRAEQRAGFTRTAIVYALRYGGKALAWLLRYFSEEAAGYVLRHATALGDFLDAAEHWAVNEIAGFLQRMGVPAGPARTIAEVIVSLV